MSLYIGPIVYLIKPFYYEAVGVILITLHKPGSLGNPASAGPVDIK